MAAAGTVQPGALYRLCYNHATWDACNFAVPAASPPPAVHCLPPDPQAADLSDPATCGTGFIEEAKRQLATLARLGLQPTDDSAPPHAGPTYAFLADPPGGPGIVTGHHGGTITLNVAGADDDERARRRIALHEPYRTLIGHLRHESGHFYWDRLVRDADKLDAFRAVFGDERLDYATALSEHYAQGARTDWSHHHVSALAAARPWEDWAETWAHYHTWRLLETAAAYATGLNLPGANAAPREHVANPLASLRRVRHHGAAMGAAHAAAQQPQPQPGPAGRLPVCAVGGAHCASCALCTTPSRKGSIVPAVRT